MKRTSGRLGVGLILVTTLVGACLAEQEKGNAPAAVTQPEAALLGTPDAKEVVLAVRAQLERAFGKTNFQLAGADAPRNMGHSFDLVGTKATSPIEFLGVTGEVGKVAAGIALPANADGAFKLRDEVSGVSIDVGLLGATASAREEANGYVVYRAGYLNGAHIVHRPTAKGTEDYVFFPETLPEKPELRYKVALSDGVAGLRLVEHTIEMLDAGGAPRLRMAPPYAVDGNGHRLAMNVAIEGCAYDTSFEMPWGRATVNPGARECTVRLSWPVDAKAPLVVDPVWSLTSDMTAVRQNSTTLMVPSGFNSKYRVLVVGGDQGLPASALNSTELFDESTNTWTAGPPLTTARTEHNMIYVGSTIWVIGGRNGSGVLASVEKLVSQSGMQPLPAMWSTLPTPMITARAQAAALAYEGSGNRVFVSGGIGAGGDALQSIDVFDPALNNGTGGWVMPQPLLTVPRVGHALAPAPTPPMGNILRVFVVGGRNGNTPLNTIERCDHSANGVVCLPKIDDVTPIGLMTTARVSPVVYYEPNGSNPRIHIIGGEGLKTAECYTLMTNMSLPTSSMTTERAYFTMNLSPLHGTNKFLIVGGVDGSGNAQKTTEVYDPFGKTFKADADLTTPRARHNTVVLSDKRVLVIGGSLGNTGTAETLHCANDTECASSTMYCSDIGICVPLKKQGDHCDLSKDCWGGDCARNICETGICADGYCCDTECTGTCEACDSKASGNVPGTCAPIAGDPHTGHGDCIAGDGDSLKCEGKCGGFDNMNCVFPVGKPCGKACVPGDPQSSAQSLSCSDKGICDVIAFESPCGNFTCADDKLTCNTSCTDNKDCITGYDCNTTTALCVEAQAKCSTQMNGMGETEDTVVSAKDDKVILDECGHYHCDTAKAECLTICSTAYDCIDGYTCDENKTCIQAHFEPTAGPAASCSASPANESSRFGWLAALAIAGVVAARRNRARA